MTQRDQRGCLLGGHDAGQPGGLQRIPFGDGAGSDQTACLGAHGDLAAGDGFAVGRRLVADIHHAGLARVVGVRKLFPGHSVNPPAQAEGASDCARKNDRLSSETVRSTLFNLTSDGTFNAPGEKLRTALIPAATTRSTTGCACTEGTAMTAMSSRSRRAMRLRSLMS